MPNTLEVSELESLDTRISLLISAAFVVAMVILFRVNTYDRPTSFYVLFAGYAGFISYQITRGGSTHKIVPQIMSLSFFTYWSVQWLFPAGMYAPDTRSTYLPAVESIITTGNIPSSMTIYAGHLAHAAEFTLLSGLSRQTGYFLIANLILVSTIPLLGMLHRVLPAVSRRTSLYAALVFSTSSWIIGRGMHPSKLNFFYVLILFLGLVTIILYRTENIPILGNRLEVIGIIIMPAIIFGHRFSAGAAMTFLLAIGTFTLLISLFAPLEYSSYSFGKRSIIFSVIYFFAVIGNPIHQGALLGRISGLILSTVQSTATQTSTNVNTGGPGRYSEFALQVLVASTAAQALLFALAVLGAVWMFRQSKWEYDLVIYWIGTISILLVVSLLFNSVDTAPQRFYGLLVLFGFNICIGALFCLIDRRGVIETKLTTVNVGRIVVVLLVMSLAVGSLASPIADKATSPVADNIPHYRQFDTEQRIQGDQWGQEYGTEIARITQPNTRVPINRTGSTTGKADLTELYPGTAVMYSSLANQTGAVLGGGGTLGSRGFAFVPSPEEPTHNRIYNNGETIGFIPN